MIFKEYTLGTLVKFNLISHRMEESVLDLPLMIKNRVILD